MVVVLQFLGGVVRGNFFPSMGRTVYFPYICHKNSTNMIGKSTIRGMVWESDVIFVLSCFPKVAQQ